jgi:hypothetical protein
VNRFVIGAAEVVGSTGSSAGDARVHIQAGAGKSIEVFVTSRGKEIRVYSSGVEWAPIQAIQIPPPPETDCVAPPPGAKDAGNGYFKLPDGRLAHRAAYELHVGPIPAGLTLDHLCRKPWCCNPDHLDPVTMTVNVLRNDSPPSRNARKTHCPNGHPLEPWKQGSRRQRCVPCRLERQAETGQISAQGRKVDRTHCPQGHEYTEANTYIARWADGSFRSRCCRTCSRDRARVRRAKRSPQQ